MKPETKSYIELHIAIFLFGFTAILGDLIQMSALHIVWWRLILTVITLVFIVNYLKIFREIPRKRLLLYGGIGLIVASHWIAFYGSLKLANASIALISMATTSFFTSLIEPLILKKKFTYYEILLGLFIIPGMVLVVRGSDTAMYAGVLVGLAAAFLAALFSTLNKKYIMDHRPMQITAVELLAALIFLTILVPLFIPEEGVATLMPVGMDWLWLIIMAVFCTTLAYYLSIKALRHLSAFTSSLTFNLEPLYGISMAYILLNDKQELNVSFYVGVGIILLVVFSYPFIRRYYTRKSLQIDLHK